MNQTIIKMLRDQAETEWRAHCLGLSLALWAKREHWQGSHKWFGRFSDGQYKNVKGICKLIDSYFGEVSDVPGSPACPSDAASLMDAYSRVLLAVKEAHDGWQAIAAEAEGSELTAIDDFADKYLRPGVEMIKRLNRFGAQLKMAGSDFAALMAFDKARK